MLFGLSHIRRGFIRLQINPHRHPLLHVHYCNCVAENLDCVGKL